MKLVTKVESLDLVVTMNWYIKRYVTVEFNWGDTYIGIREFDDLKLAEKFYNKITKYLIYKWELDDIINDFRKWGRMETLLSMEDRIIYAYQEYVENEFDWRPLKADVKEDLPSLGLGHSSVYDDYGNEHFVDSVLNTKDMTHTITVGTCIYEQEKFENEEEIHEFLETFEFGNITSIESDDGFTDWCERNGLA